MSRTGDSSFTRLGAADVRRSAGLAYANGALWGLGSGLASMTLMIYLAREYGASAVAISWLIAAPSFAGLLRLATPYWLAKVGSRRRFCVLVFSASAAVMYLLPLLSAPGVLAGPRTPLVVLAITWVSYYALEYIGVVALWSWFGDLVPAPVRGRFVGRREACTTGGAVVGSVIAAVATLLWRQHCEAAGTSAEEWKSYAACGLAGAVMYALAVFPLAWMTDLPLATSATTGVRLGWRELVAPLVDLRYRRFMSFGLWFSFSNGIIQAAQNMYPMNVLGLTFTQKKALDGGSRGIQALVLPWIGAAVDRRGNVRILAASQALIAVATLFFLPATPGAQWWVLGAYVAWLAFGGHNVTLPNLMLGLSPPEQTAAYAAAWFAWTQLAYALSALAGGWLLDWSAEHFALSSVGGLSFDHFALLFVASWVLKSMGVVLALRIPEPKHP